MISTSRVNVGLYGWRALPRMRVGASPKWTGPGQNYREHYSDRVVGYSLEYIAALIRFCH